MYKVNPTTKFKKDLKKAEKRGLNLELLNKVIKILANGEQLPAKYKDHALTGNYKDFRECHIQPDWLLVYAYENKELILVLSQTGSHSDLFR